MPPEMQPATFQNASQAKTAGGNIRHLNACAQPWGYSWPQQDRHVKTEMFLPSVTTPV